MTEAEWLAGTDPTPMLEFLEGKASERKLRLFGVLCCRQKWDLFPDDLFRDAILLAEQCAEGAVDEGELASAESAIYDYAESTQSAEEYFFQPVRLLGLRDQYTYTTAHAVWAARQIATTTRFNGRMEIDDVDSNLLTEQAAFLRDIIGNPFRPVTAVPRWLTSTAVSLAQTIYDQRSFDRLPILADAIEEAGCDNPDILNHLRSDGPHGRGCWAVDLVLRKE